MNPTPLHGARIRRGRWHPGARTFELELEACDAQGLAVRVLLRYRNVHALEPALPQLAALVEDVNLHVAGDACSRGTEGEQHTLRLAPAGAITIACGTVERTESPTTGEDYGERGFRFDVRSC